MTKVTIGCGAGFAGDRFDAAVPIVAALANVKGERFLIYEVLAERTLAIAQRLRREHPEQGYSPFLDTYLPLVLADCQRHGIRIVTNMGAANPLGAARRVHGLARELGIRGLKVAAVTGDDLLASMTEAEIRGQPIMEGIALGERSIVREQSGCATEWGCYSSAICATAGIGIINRIDSGKRMNPWAE